MARGRPHRHAAVPLKEPESEVVVRFASMACRWLGATTEAYPRRYAEEEQRRQTLKDGGR
jgi:hypothetical protein